jgi:hypothetical protein
MPKEENAVMKFRQFAFASLIGFSAIPTAEAVTISKPKAVVELFTSQGCSSCPPADKVVGKFASETDVLAISLHVDYWNYLGWKDSFSSKDNTKRQYGYATTFSEQQVYTPQAVINGQTHVVGSKEASIRNTAADMDNTGKGLSVPIDVKVEGKRLVVSVEQGISITGDATLYILSMSREEAVKIERGENAGKTIKYHNVLKDIQPVGMLKADGLSMDFPISELKQNGYDCHAILLQTNDGRGNPARILGAVFIEDL